MEVPKFRSNGDPAGAAKVPLILSEPAFHPENVKFEDGRLWANDSAPDHTYISGFMRMVGGHVEFESTLAKIICDVGDPSVYV